MSTLDIAALHRANFLSEAFEKLTVSSTAKELSAGVYGTRRYALISVEGDQIRWRADGSDPDATMGHLVEPGQDIELDSNEDIVNWRGIRVTGDATIQVTYSEKKLTA